jgi:hypothetical protein
MQNRRSKTLGPGHGINLQVGKKPPPRPDNYMPGVLLPKQLVKPAERLPALPGAQDTTLGSGGAVKQKGPRAPRTGALTEFQDMEPGEVKDGYVPRPGSTIAVALEMTEREAGATLEDIQTELDKLGTHNALKLLQFMNGGKGYGFKKQDDGTIKRWMK